MAQRILHCGKSLTNYCFCLEERVAGFSGAKAETGDLIYFAVKTDRGSVCGGRGRLAAFTERNPWKEHYPFRFELSEIEFCSPFELSILKTVGGPHWPVKYLQGSKPIKDLPVQQLLADTFRANKTDKLIRL
jgi:hypothetical protein